MPEEDFTDEQMQDFIQNQAPGLLRESSWGKLPATSKQKRLLKKLGTPGISRADAFLLINDRS